MYACMSQVSYACVYESCLMPSRTAAGDASPMGDITGEIVDSISTGWKPAQISNMLTFLGADFSPLAYVALTRTRQCSDRQYVTALAEGSASQAAALRFSIRYPGTYHVCYSVTGNSGSSTWSLQPAELVVVPAAVTGTVTALTVCGYDVGGAAVCVEGRRVRIPSGISYSFQFIGLDYSNTNRAAFSQSIHPFYERPDCSRSAWRSEDVVVSAGNGTQSDALFVTGDSCLL
jgi:hypothetical protein